MGPFLHSLWSFAVRNNRCIWTSSQTSINGNATILCGWAWVDFCRRIGRRGASRLLQNKQKSGCDQTLMPTRSTHKHTHTHIVESASHFSKSDAVRCGNSCSAEQWEARRVLQVLSKNKTQQKRACNYSAITDKDLAQGMKPTVAQQPRRPAVREKLPLKSAAAAAAVVVLWKRAVLTGTARTDATQVINKNGPLSDRGVKTWPTKPC